MTRTVHFHPPAVTADMRDVCTGNGNITEELSPNKNAIDALGAVGRDLSLLHEMASTLVSDPSGRHGHLHVMRRATYRLQDSIKLLIELEER